MARPQFTEPAKFFDHFARQIVPVSECGCWIWMGATCNGYGEVKVSGRRQFAHRVSAEAAGRLTDPSNMVRHQCDMPLCVNPDHLIEGRQIDNMADMKSRGRQSRGAHRPKAKLTEDDVREIRHLLSLGAAQASVARRFGVSQARISRINSGKLWSHVQ